MATRISVDADGGTSYKPVGLRQQRWPVAAPAAFLSMTWLSPGSVHGVVVFDSKRIGLGYKMGVDFVALSYIRRIDGVHGIRTRERYPRQAATRRRI